MTEVNHNCPCVRIVDDDEKVRIAFKFALTSEGFDVQTFASADDFLANDDRNRSGCVVLDVRMPEMTGTELFDRMIQQGYPHPVIFLSGHGDIDMAVKAVKKGAFDFLQKPSDMNEFMSIVREAVTFDMNPRRISDQGCMKLVNKLTDRERQIVRFLLKGISNASISERLALSIRTVENHRALAYRKLDVTSIEELRSLLKNVQNYL